MVLSQIRKSWIKSIKLCSPEDKSGGSASNQVVLNQFRWSCVKSGGPDSNQMVLNQLRQSWIESVKFGSSEVKSGGPESNQVVRNQMVLSQFRWFWVKLVNSELNQPVLGQIR